eukprot:CAMPEP_0117061606 /NCGR_PEP_ID=MMETSP0472-20121206/42888_1 /TAXON_ID=693140 ORGANISM="Tiarina fusus, Strain LIS" /NCGR_SAMPLE_ID=MMETSP0472 /ASSEMBLY_ACC=CAM_ASM_000603 /LENGTH=48 /DNA_ID= /DNA_START= /DNA_END= /DNA_ORIENTATION=
MDSIAGSVANSIKGEQMSGADLGGMGLGVVAGIAKDVAIHKLYMHMMD